MEFLSLFHFLFGKIYINHQTQKKNLTTISAINLLLATIPKKHFIESTFHSELTSPSPCKPSLGSNPAISTIVDCIGKETWTWEICFKLKEEKFPLNLFADSLWNQHLRVYEQARISGGAGGARAPHCKMLSKKNK